MTNVNACRIHQVAPAELEAVIVTHVNVCPNHQVALADLKAVIVTHVNACLIHQVAPAELEAVIVTHPEVLEAAVIPVADERAGELPKAYVSRKPGASVTEEDITQFVAGVYTTYNSG